MQWQRIYCVTFSINCRGRLCVQTTFFSEKVEHLSGNGTIDNLLLEAQSDGIALLASKTIIKVSGGKDLVRINQ